MKRISAILFVLILLLVSFSLNVFAAEETPDISKVDLPKPQAPQYMMLDAADRTATEGSDMLEVIAVYDWPVLELGSEYEADSDAFYKKYGLYSFGLYMQFDTSLDGTDNWNYTSEWDTCYWAPSSDEATAVGSVCSEMFERVTIFDLYKKSSYPESYTNIADAVIQRDVPDGEYIFQNFYFDRESHSLSIRCRYYMEWETYDGETVGERQSMTGEWSDIAVFGKGSTAVTPAEPTGYEAPIISDLKYVQPGEGDEIGYLTYIQTTPQQVWEAGIYYEMTGSGSFDGLETEICLDGGDWQPYNTVDAWGDWCLWNGLRTGYWEEPRIEADSQIQFRVRYLGTHGPSEWSNVLTLNDGGTQEVPEETHAPAAETPAPTEVQTEEKCGICGFCPEPLGLCIFIWLAILLAVVIILIVIIVISKKNKRRNKE